jgi:diadenylate cyclase
VPSALDSLRFRDALEIVIELAVIWAFVFVIFRFLRGTRGAGVIKGFFLLTIGLALLVRVLGDATDGFERLRFLFDRVFNLLAILLIVVFQPEIRAAFGRIGRAKLFRRSTPATDGVATEIAEAAAFLSKNRFGALIVIERRIGIGDLLTGGLELDAKASASLIESIFWPNSPLHDLALVVRGDRLAAAGVQLPLADGEELPSTLGARHRAALGVSEESDALVVVVSEETGQVRLAEGGSLSASVPLDELEQVLESRLSRSAAASVAADAPAAGEGEGEGAAEGAAEGSAEGSAGGKNPVARPGERGGP